MLPLCFKAAELRGAGVCHSVWKLPLFFQTPFHGRTQSLSLICTSLYFFIYPLEKWAAFHRVPDVLCLQQHSGICFVGIYSALRMFSGWCGKVVSPSYSLRHLRIATSSACVPDLVCNSVLSFQLSFSCIFFLPLCEKQFHIHLIAASISNGCIKHF